MKIHSIFLSLTVGAVLFAPAPWRSRTCRFKVHTGHGVRRL